mgnify:CR=1 FL=1
MKKTGYIVIQVTLFFYAFLHILSAVGFNLIHHLQQQDWSNCNQFNVCFLATR